MCFVYFKVKVWYKMACCKKNSCFCLILTLFRCPLITENKFFFTWPGTVKCDPQLSNLHDAVRYSKDRDLQINDFMNCIKVKRNSLLNSIYSSVSPYFRFKETPYVNFYTDLELSSSLYQGTVGAQYSYQLSRFNRVHHTVCEPCAQPCFVWDRLYWHVNIINII